MNMISSLPAELSSHGLFLQSRIYQTNSVQVYVVADSTRATYVVKSVKYPLHQPNEVALRESNVSETLSHPNIAKCYYSFWFYDSPQSWTLALVLEHLPEDLMQEINRRKVAGERWSERELLTMISGLVDALAYMQRQGLGHRDVKPQNILHQDGILKLTDFGSAKDCGNSYDHSLAGTPFFLSPELKLALMGNAPAVQHNVYKSDVYSLGLVLLMLCTLQAPTALVDLQSLEAVTQAQIAAVRYGQEIKSLLTAMLAVDPNSRPDFIGLLRMLPGLQRDVSEQANRAVSGEADSIVPVDDDGGFQDYVSSTPPRCSGCNLERKREFLVPQETRKFLCLSCLKR